MTAITGITAMTRSARQTAILLLSGLNLTLIQWVMVRELTALLFGTELVALFVTSSAFVGYSLGYWFGNRLSERTLRRFAALTLPLHVALPILYRLLMSGLGSLGQFRIGFVVLLAITPFVVSAFYSLFLPRFASTGGGLMRVYAIELGGVLLGILALVILSNQSLIAFVVPYTLIAVCLLALIGLPRLLLFGYAVLGLAWCAALPALDAASNALVYRTVHDLNGAQSVASIYSAYQKVDVLRDGEGRLYLYLNGLMDYGSGSLARFNVMLSGIPAQLLHPNQMAVVGSGSMMSVALAAPHAAHITTVELDPVVAALSRDHFAAINHLERVTNWRLVIDDAKHYFGANRIGYDLISMDVPAPFTVQEGLLHTREYYQLLKQNLSANGVISVSLSSTLRPDHTLARRVLAGLLANFKEVIVVTSGSADMSFAYAGDHLPFDVATLQNTLRANDESQFVIYQLPAVQMIVADAAPIQVDDMSEIWALSLSHVRRLLGAS